MGDFADTTGLQLFYIILSCRLVKIVPVLGFDKTPRSESRHWNCSCLNCLPTDTRFIYAQTAGSS